MIAVSLVFSSNTPELRRLLMATMWGPLSKTKHPGIGIMYNILTALGTSHPMGYYGRPKSL